jgi:hypothetical protein
VLSGENFSFDEATILQPLYPNPKTWFPNLPTSRVNKCFSMNEFYIISIGTLTPTGSLEVFGLTRL